MKYPIPYRKKDKWGFSDVTKELLIDCLYEEVIFPFSEENFGLALVKLSGKQCWIDSAGKQLSPPADNVLPFAPNGISIIILDDNNATSRPSIENCLFIDRFGESVFTLPAIRAYGFTNDRCMVLFPNQKYGAINAQGAVVIQPESDNFEVVFEALGRPYFSDSNKISKQNEDLIKFEADQCFGYKDREGNLIFGAEYFSASDFNEGTAMVARCPKAFYHINSNGRKLYDKVYYYGFNFENGIAKVVCNMPDANPFVHARWGVDYYIPPEARWGYIDKNGIEFWED